MRIGLRFVASLLALVMAALAPLATAQAQSADDFYQPPAADAMPSTNGALIRQRSMDLSWIKVGDLQVPIGGVGTLIMYRSSDLAGNPVAVTGVYVEPNQPWRGDGPRPLVSLALATQGEGDACAPSKSLSRGLNFEDGHLMVNYEIPFISTLVARGVAVVMTDYIGLGNPETPHSYVNRIDQGHAVLDAVRAALALPNTGLSTDSPIGLYGYSQGGSASGAAAELAASYAPELNMRGAYVGSPVADLTESLKVIDGSLISGVIAWEIAGNVQYYPDLVPLLPEVFNDRGLRWLDSSADQCITDVLLVGFRPTSLYTRTGESLTKVLQRYPAIEQVLEDQRLGKVAPEMPVLVVTGTQDDLVGHQQVKQMASNWCDLGANVTYRPYIELFPSFGFGYNHTWPVAVEPLDAQNWLVERLRNQPVESNCSRISILP